MSAERIAIDALWMAWASARSGKAVDLEQFEALVRKAESYGVEFHPRAAYKQLRTERYPSERPSATELVAAPVSRVIEMVRAAGGRR